MKPLYVRCVDRTVFPINRETLDPISCGCYDAYCYSDPRSDVDYMEHSEWCRERNKKWDREMRTKLGYSRIGLGNV